MSRYATASVSVTVTSTLLHPPAMGRGKAEALTAIQLNVSQVLHRVLFATWLFQFLVELNVYAKIVDTRPSRSVATFPLKNSP
jgi:hypothetical protein